MAAQLIFDTAELLELILCELSTREILLAQRVCKTWKANITTSKKLQRALFMRPAKGGTLEYKEWNESRTIIALGRTTRRTDTTCGFVEPGRKKTMTVYKNPLLHKFEFALTAKVAPQYAIQRLPPAWQRKNASWKSMYLTQPPISKLCTSLWEWQSGETQLTIDTTLSAGVLEQIQTCVKKAGMSEWSSEVFAGSTLWKKLEHNAQIEELPKENPEGVGIKGRGVGVW